MEYLFIVLLQTLLPTYGLEKFLVGASGLCTEASHFSSDDNITDAIGDDFRKTFLNLSQSRQSIRVQQMLIQQNKEAQSALSNHQVRI